jgi:rod shape-determining protein MreB
MVYSRSLRIAGNHMDEAIMNYVKRKYNLLIGDRTAEQIKIKIGSAYALDKPLTMEIKGRKAGTSSRVCQRRSPWTTAKSGRR